MDRGHGDRGQGDRLIVPIKKITEILKCCKEYYENKKQL
jgi:hypothetical protein